MSTMPRRRWPFPLEDTLPKPSGPFSDAESLDLLMAYRKCPGDLPCPRCARTHGPDTIEVLSFIEPEIDPNGFATVTEPEGTYAVAVMCRVCKCAIGLLAGEGN